MSKKINYCIIGDYKNLPISIEHDLDIWTDNTVLVYECIRESCIRTGFQVLIYNHNSNGFTIVVYKKNKSSIDIIKLDIMRDCSFKSCFTLVSSNEISNNIDIYKGYNIANKTVESLMHFLFPYFEYNGLVKKKYRSDIIKHIKTDLFINKLKQLFGEKITSEITTYVINENWEKLRKTSRKFIYNAIMRFMFKGGFFQYKKVANVILNNIQHYFKRTGYHIAICGIDGAGKTTIVNNLKCIFTTILKEKKVFFSYWRPYVLPEINRILKRRDNIKDVQFDMAKDRVAYGKFISLIKFIYYYIDYVVGYIKYINVCSKGGIAIFDRYYLDTVAFPQRFKLNLPKKFILFFYRYIPIADYTFFLWTNPEQIHLRKAEFSLGEIHDQINEYRKYGKNIRNYYEIKTNTTVNEEICEIFDILSYKLNSSLMIL
ncbi:MAG: hypothetical protein M0R03_19165 [Novosphingobium sp.]|nr:hypothetical protein [Novosphingobium sp.]